MSARRFRVGFLVNPIAGLGGPAGWKGSDSGERVSALAAASDPDELNAFRRALDFLTNLHLKGGVMVAAPGPLGESVLKKSMMCGGPIFEIVRIPGWSKQIGETAADDTTLFAKRFLREDLDLLVFVGGDGTAVDVATAVGDKIPILGVPAGVKVFSGIFAESPIVARTILQSLQPGFATQPVDVVDLDEESYQRGRWMVRSLATARVPVMPGVQTSKGGDIPAEEDSILDLVEWFRTAYDPNTLYILGAGSTLAGIKAHLKGGTPLGVDAYQGGRFVATDASAADLERAVDGASHMLVLVSPTAGQGCVLGRGTAQIAPTVLEKIPPEALQIVATPGKLVGLRDLFVDTGDLDVDARFPDYVKVRTDALTEKVFRLRKPALAI